MLDSIGAHQFDAVPENTSHFIDTEHPSTSEMREIFLHPGDCSLPILEMERGQTTVQFLRLCSICKDLLQKKLERLEFHQHPSPIISLHSELRRHMQNVEDSLPLYSSIAESLHSGEQRYALETAKSMRHEIVESLQRVDLLGRQLEDMAALCSSDSTCDKPNLATVRLLRTLSKMARHFLQTSLPPLRALPTLQQYGSLTAQRQDELAARWIEEEQALAQLEMRVASGTKPRASTKLDSAAPDAVENLAKLASDIDAVSAQLIRARGDTKQVQNLTRQLERLEGNFQKLSSSLQKHQI